MSSPSIPKVVPAQLSFLSIYNPSLGNSDETLDKQIVFYHPKLTSSRTKREGKDGRPERELREQENEKLRQVGLAQGMVSFARFAKGETLNSVETHKSRIVMHELESGWWILASIDLTRLPPATAHSKIPDKTAHASATVVEYSSREVSPPALLVEQLLSAHSIFLLHHGPSLQELFHRVGRAKFCNLLDRFWSRFAANWDIMLHGSPAVDIFGGIKLAAGGELGIGVGEEEWGSGEREVLEDYARRTEGLVDIVVSRFGEPSPLQYNPHHSSNERQELMETASDHEQWLGSGRSAGASDGIVFAGLGALSRKSLSDLSHWIETIYSYGEYAYGVRENPSSDRRKRRRTNKRNIGSDRSSSEAHDGDPQKDYQQSPRSQPVPKALRPESRWAPGIPPPIVTAVETSLDNATSATENPSAATAEPIKGSTNDSETWMKYLTLGYGTAWGGTRAPTSDQSSPSQVEPETRSDSGRTLAKEATMRHIEPVPHVDQVEERRKAQIRQETKGYFLIGLKGDMENEQGDEEDDDEGEWNNRIPLRTLYVELLGDISLDVSAEEGIPAAHNSDQSDQKSNSCRFTRLRPIVYINRPFIYTFLFQHRTESLGLASFYRNLHTYFAPLHRPLSNSTSPGRVAARIAAASSPYTTMSAAAGASPNAQPIYDLIYDAQTLTVHSSIPNIPDSGTLVAEGLGGRGAEWSRMDGLNVHSQVLATVSGTRRNMSEIERTCKTSRGWWVVWMRLPPSSSSQSSSRSAEASADGQGAEAMLFREAFLVRRARDGGVAGGGSRAGLGGGGGGGGGGGSGTRLWRPSIGSLGGIQVGAAGWGPRGLAEGLGIDARRYVEGLLSLNR